MTQIIRDPDGMITYPDWLVGEEVRCLVCGKSADAEWRGEDNIHVCFSCAKRFLPRLMADACCSLVSSNNPHVSSLFSEEKDIVIEFWRGIACAMGIRRGKELLDAAKE